MTGDPDEDLMSVLAATWPAAESQTTGTVTLNKSPGGGQRVTAARVAPGPLPSSAALADAETQMTEWGQSVLYMIGAGNTALDDHLAARGFRIGDPTILYHCPLEPLLAIETPRLSTFVVWPVLAIQADIWLEGGVGPDRLAVMERAKGPRTTLLGRAGDRPAATGFVACHRDVAMVHALEVRATQRRQGVARRMMGRAAQWARDQGCASMALAVTGANEGARAFYASLGMVPAGRYHYRIQPPEPS